MTRLYSPPFTFETPPLGLAVLLYRVVESFTSLP